MEKNNLVELIEKFRNQNITAFALIFSEFEKLITHYKKRLGDEDSFQELSAFLVELLYKIDLSRFLDGGNDRLKRYIAVCIRNKYIAISKEKSFYENFACPLMENYPSSDMDLFRKHTLKDAVLQLTEKQREIVLYSYVYNYTDLEIAAFFNISPQAVGRLKARALKTLRMYFLGGI